MRRTSDDLKKAIISSLLLFIEVGVGYAFFGTRLFAIGSSNSVRLGTASIGTGTTTTTTLTLKNSSIAGRNKGAAVTTSSTTTTSMDTTTTVVPTTTTQVATTTTSTPTPDSAYANITVRVANGTSIPGLAERITTYLGNVGFDVVSPVNATTPVQSSTVYYAPGFSVSAQYIAARLGLSSRQVIPDSSAIPVNAPPEDINVIVGPNLSSAP